MFLQRKQAKSHATQKRSGVGAENLSKEQVKKQTGAETSTPAQNTPETKELRYKILEKYDTKKKKRKREISSVAVDYGSDDNDSNTRSAPVELLSKADMFSLSRQGKGVKIMSRALEIRQQLVPTANNKSKRQKTESASTWQKPW